MSLIAELKRRNVFKVTTAYLALGWVVLEGSGTVASVLRLPDWTSSLLFWLGLAGLPFVVVFAWVFELTPEGLQRTTEVAAGQSITHVTSKRLDYVIIGMLVVAIGLFLLQYFRPPAPVVASSDATVTPTAPTAEAAPPGPSVPGLEPAVVSPDDKSIAVLPFVNMSSDKEQEYFSDGMSEELLNLLAQAPDLKVIARTSSFAFKGKDVPIAEIARQLNVAHVLEGSVRKSGNTVRITAQLIHAADSTHLWSDTYDRPLDDIFKVQDEIAGAIAGALQIRLKGGTLSRREGGTQNLEAYELYLRAVHAGDISSKESLDAAEAWLEQAVALDPEFGLAWSLLAMNHVIKIETGAAKAEDYQRVVQHAQRGIEASPGLADAYSALAIGEIGLNWDWQSANRNIDRALNLGTNSAFAMNDAARISEFQGRWHEAEQRYRRGLARSPLDPYLLLNLAWLHRKMGRNDEAEVELEKLAGLHPDFYWVHGMLADVLLTNGKPDRAKATAMQIQDEAYRKGMLLAVQCYVLCANGRTGEARVILDELFANAKAEGDGAYWVAAEYSNCDMKDPALDALEVALEQRDSLMVEILGDPKFDGIRQTPRFKTVLHKMNLPETPPG